MFKPESVALMGLFFSVVSCCLSLAILLMVSRMKLSKSQNEMHEAMMRFLIVVALALLVGLASAQDGPMIPDQVDLVAKAGPVVFPGPMQQANAGLASWFEQAAWLSSVSAFFGNNSTNCLNYTAPVSA